MPDRPTEADLARWEALADQATPGPWTARHRDSSNPTQDPARDGEHLGWHLDPLAVPDRGQIVRGADAAFLAESRTAVPALVNEVRRLQQFIEIAALALEDTGHRTGAEALRRGALTHSLMKPADA